MTCRERILVRDTGIAPRTRQVPNTLPADLQIRPLARDTWRPLADLFAAGGDPRWCWCQYWRKPGANWSNTTPDANRADLDALVRVGDPSPGLVALRDGAAVGWAGLGPREAFPRLGRSRVLPQLPGYGVWSINCFVV